MIHHAVHKRFESASEHDTFQRRFFHSQQRVTDDNNFTIIPTGQRAASFWFDLNLSQRVSRVRYCAKSRHRKSMMCNIFEKLATRYRVKYCAKDRRWHFYATLRAIDLSRTALREKLVQYYIT